MLSPVVFLLCGGLWPGGSMLRLHGRSVNGPSCGLAVSCSVPSRVDGDFTYCRIKQMRVK